MPMLGIECRMPNVPCHALVSYPLSRIQLRYRRGGTSGLKQLVFRRFPEYHAFDVMISPKLRLMLGGGFITLTAVWLIVSALGSYFHTHSFVKSALQAEGIVVRLVDGTSPSVHYPIYVFQDADGKWHQVFTDVPGNERGSMSPETKPANYKVRDKVPLLYLPDHPALAVRGTYWSLWKRPVVMGGLGVLDLLFGLAVLWVAKSQ